MGDAPTAEPMTTHRKPSRWVRAIPGLIILASMVGVIAHQYAFFTWFIEDAAISFAYARNMVIGEGLVTNIGGERIEGYSNFTWVLILALFEFFGLDGFTVSKWITFALGALTIPVLYGLVRIIEPRRQAPALFACIALAANSQFAHWGASGLENSLFSLLLALGLWRTAVELKHGGWPVSALFFFLLSATRPEGIMYAAFTGFLVMVFTLEERRNLTHTFKWLATFFLPWTAYQAWRFQYFGWEFPNTYYAKMNAKEPSPFDWNRRGWKYVRNWAHGNWHAYLLPVYLLGLLGHRNNRHLLALGASFAVAFSAWFGINSRALFPVVVICTVWMFFASYRVSADQPSSAKMALGVIGTALVACAGEGMHWYGVTYQGLETVFSEPPTPSWWSGVPSYGLMALAAVLPFFSRGTPQARLRTLCWTLCAVGLFFAIYVQGDWMSNWRWMSLIAVPLAALFGLGVDAFGHVIGALLTGRDRWGIPGWVTGIVCLGLTIGPNVHQTNEAKRDTGPYSVKKRVQYMTGVAERLHIEGKVKVLDVDMGAHMYWSDFHMLDIAGLVDVSMAQHKFARPFLQEYLFEEEKPHFAHVHGGWATNSKIPTFVDWRREYFEIPGYPAGRTALHIGNHVRKDLIVQPGWPHGEDRKVRYDNGLHLEGWRIPSNQVAEKRLFYLEVGFRNISRRKDDNFRVLMFLESQGQVHASWDLAPGYDWLTPNLWGPQNVFHGKYTLSLPKEVPAGTYNLGFVLLGADGRPMVPANDLPLSDMWVGGSDRPAVYANGEVVFSGALHVTTLEQRASAAKDDRNAAYARAREGACEEAEESWWLATKHRPRDTKWMEQFEDKIHEAMARCWIKKAQDEPDTAFDSLLRARALDRKLELYDEVSRPFCDALVAEGKTAMAENDWETAYRLFRQTIQLQPTRSHVRRLAEDARARRLKLPPYDLVPTPRTPDKPTNDVPSAGVVPVNATAPSLPQQATPK